MIRRVMVACMMVSGSALIGCGHDSNSVAAGVGAERCTSNADCASGTCGTTAQPGFCVRNDGAHDQSAGAAGTNPSGSNDNHAQAGTGGGYYSDDDGKSDEDNGADESAKPACSCSGSSYYGGGDDSGDDHGGDSNGGDDKDGSSDEGHKSTTSSKCSCPTGTGGTSSGTGGTSAGTGGVGAGTGGANPGTGGSPTPS